MMNFKERDISPHATLLDALKQMDKIEKGIPELESGDRVLAPEKLHDIGDFFDQWVDNPIKVNELHNIKEKTSKLVRELKEQREFSKFMMSSMEAITENIKLMGKQSEINSKIISIYPL